LLNASPLNVKEEKMERTGTLKAWINSDERVLMEFESLLEKNKVTIGDLMELRLFVTSFPNEAYDSEDKLFVTRVEKSEIGYNWIGPDEEYVELPSWQGIIRQLVDSKDIIIPYAEDFVYQDGVEPTKRLIFANYNATRLYSIIE
jgi:hypothetical protein